ncbi:MAG: T9SS type A sorting domain-containing protein [Syntrophothermus sp.]
MRRIFTVLLILVAAGLSYAQTTANVTFNVNMGVQVAKAKFKIATDSVYLAGTMNGWSTNATVLRRTASTTDTVYSVTLPLIVDSTYEFKALAPAGAWESVSNRKFKVTATPANNIVTFYYNDDKTYPAGTAKAIKVTFRVNMEIEIAKGFFDISKDQVNVRGIGGKWDSSPLIMAKALTSNTFSKDTTITMTQTDSLEYKYAYLHGANTVWESGSNFKFGVSAAEFAAGAVVLPVRYFDNADKTASDNAFDVYFTVNTKGAIPSGGGTFTQGVKSVVVCGSQLPLLWPAAGWPDSSLTSLVKANDDGTNGDQVKGDGIWTAKVTFPKFSSISFEYKYGINYGMAGANGGVNDNENSIGENHKLTLPKTVTLIRTTDTFGKMGASTFTGVKEMPAAVVSEFALSQNYPNPFNPSTVISFSIPARSNVVMKVYDILGKVVAELVNGEYNTGKYEVTFDASKLTSGLYFYSIQAGSYSATKKMMLVK